MIARAALALSLAVAASTGAAQQSLVWFSPTSAAQERDAERDAIGRPSPVSAAAHSRTLARETHVAGTPAQVTTRDYVIAQMKSWGIETEVRAYDVFMPHPTAVRVLRVSPQPKELALKEPAIVGDPTSATAQYLTVNGYSGQGDVTGEVVYVNYGLIEDYAQLDSIGVSVRGKIAIARYGKSFRGIKAREAEKRGALALIIYSDPQDDGFVRGDVFPDGPMRPAFGVQRGSVLNIDGDPSTPGYASVTGVLRLDMNAMSIPHIPVVPMGYGNATELLQFVRGKAVPQTWQGGLAFRYHVGPGPVQARVVVADDRATKPFKPIYDTFGTIRGSDFPDELVIIGGHRDGWGPGAADNVSGTVSVLEAARAVAEQMKNGMRPKRTIVFATWDAEEWGLIGSTEYVEDDSALVWMKPPLLPTSIRTWRRRGRSLVEAVRRLFARRCGMSRDRCRIPMGKGASTTSGVARVPCPTPPSRQWTIPAADQTLPASTITSVFRSSSGVLVDPAGSTIRSTTTPSGRRVLAIPAISITQRPGRSPRGWYCGSRTPTSFLATMWSMRGPCGATSRTSIVHSRPRRGRRHRPASRPPWTGWSGRPPRLAGRATRR